MSPEQPESVILLRTGCSLLPFFPCRMLSTEDMSLQPIDLFDFLTNFD